MRTKGVERREGGISGVDAEEGGVVKEPERVLESLERNWLEVSSGEAGNCAGKMRGVPKIASAGESLESSWGVDR